MPGRMGPVDRMRRRRWEALEDLATRVARLEHAEQVLVRVVVRTYGEDPLASPFQVRPLTEQVILSAPMAVLADLFRYAGAAEVSLLSPVPGFTPGWTPNGDQFVDVIMTRADG